MPARAVASQSLFAPSAAGSKRFLNLHEYQSKDLMEKFGVNVQKGRMASNAAEAKEISDWILRDSACAPPPRACHAAPGLAGRFAAWVWRCDACAQHTAPGF